MIDIYLDADVINDKYALFSEIRNKLKLEDYYELNMDAYYDVLSTISDKVTFHIPDEEALSMAIPFYGQRMIDIIKLAAIENDTCVFVHIGNNDVEEELW